MEAYNLILLQPMLNGLILLTKVLFGNFGLAILAVTIIVRLLMLPLTLRQLRATKAMSQITPKLQELQKRYAKDRQKLAQEQTRLYKEHGINPMGCILPLVIQFPIWIALYQSVLKALAATPDELLGLSQQLYSLPLIRQAVPLESHFLWLDLARPDRFFILPILVGGTMWLQQKMSTLPTADPRQQQMNQMMMTMMPLMFAFFTLQFASGLAIYWVASNVIGIVMQYFITGWGSLFSRGAPRPAPQPTPTRSGPTPSPASGERSGHGRSRGKRQDRRGGRKAGPRAPRRR